MAVQECSFAKVGFGLHRLDQEPDICRKVTVPESAGV